MMAGDRKSLAHLDKKRVAPVMNVEEQKQWCKLHGIWVKRWDDCWMNLRTERWILWSSNGELRG
jgi:hypothetical protein